MIKQYDFDEEIERRGTNCLKYDGLAERYGRTDLTPMWVADMDFRTPAFITDALLERCQHPIFGYTLEPEEYRPTIISWLRELYGWDVQSEWLSYIPGIVKGIAVALDVFTSRGDRVIVQTPVYHPFMLVPERMGREVVYNPLRMVDGAYEMDFEQLESVVDGCKALILSSPHNPAGIVWEKAVLQRLASICSRSGTLVISDEIHAEMVFSGYEHHPFATVSAEAAANSITFMAPSKTFNIAGIVSSYAIVPDERIRREFYGFLSATELNEAPIFSYIAPIAAYGNGAEWRRQMVEYVEGNVDFVDKYIRANISQIRVYRPQASFLIWLDCRGLGLSQRELVRLFIDGAHLALNDGAMFGIGGEGFMRMNVGCPRRTVASALEALRAAVPGY